MRKAVSAIAIIALFSISVLALNLQTAKADELVGDVNGDGVVDLKDVYAAGSAFGSTPESPKWNQRVDINGDNKIDMVDMYIIASHFGEKTVTVITLTVHVCPRFLNLRSKGRWITVYIKLPEGYNASDVDVSSIRLNNTVPAEPRPIAIKGCHGVQGLIVKFDRQRVIDLILANHRSVHRFETITLTITGRLRDGNFQGSDRIKVMFHVSCKH